MTQISKYRWINIILLVLVAGLYLINKYYGVGLCDDLECLYNFGYKYSAPISVSFPWLVVSLAALLFFPADIFRRWLFYAGGPFLFFSVWQISLIETKGGSIISPTRVGMAELLMQGLLILTVLFIAGHYARRWYKSRK